MTCKLLLKDNLRKIIEKNKTKNLGVYFAYIHSRVEELKLKLRKKRG